MSKELIDRLAVIQQALKAPKNQYNKFGKYKYRSCEDILEGLKIVLNGLVVTVEDDVIMVGDRVYIKSTATLTDGENSITNSAFARESLTKKGMDDSQITGTASSYARKYALNGLFLIDDNKDADYTPPDEDALSWVNAINNKLTTIDDPKLSGDYKEYIRGLL